MSSKLSADIPDAIAQAIRQRNGGQCEACRFKPEKLDVHHLLRRGMGGTDVEWIHCPCNLVALCRLCHDWAHAQPALAAVSGLMVATTSRPWLTLTWIHNPNYGAPAWFSRGCDLTVTWTGDNHPPAHVPPRALAPAA